MAIAVTTIGFTSTKTAGLSLALTIPAGGVPANAEILVAFGINPGGSTGKTVTDTAGNTYAMLDDAGVLPTAFNTEWWRAQDVAALVSGNTISFTSTLGNFGVRAISAVYLQHVQSALDQGNGAAGSSTTPASGAITTTLTPDIVLGAITRNGPTTESWTQDADTDGGVTWTQIHANQGTSGGGAASNITMSTAYKLLAATGTHEYNGTFGSSRGWAASIISLTEVDTGPPRVRTELWTPQTRRAVPRAVL